MALNPLQKYGIKEVADVTFYEVNEDESRGAPVLFLDTLKVSTIEQTAESTDATGGKGNATLITWDYGKEINVTLEDALFSAKSLAMMFGGSQIADLSTSGVKIEKTINFRGTTVPTKWTLPGGGEQDIDPLVSTIYNAATGDEVESGALTADADYYITFEVSNAAGSLITISADTFPGVYYVTGDTFARSQATGKDEFFQFIIPKAKMLAENNITLEAAGDPTVFNLSLKVLRPTNKKMMYLVSYALEADEVTP